MQRVAVSNNIGDIHFHFEDFFHLSPVSHRSAKIIQMTLSMTFIPSKRCIEIEIILKKLAVIHTSAV